MNTMTRILTDLLIDQFGLAAEDIRPEMTFEELGVDSLVLTELTVILENEFDLVIEDGELTEGLTVRQAAQLAAARLPAPTTHRGAA
ncbi:acyl carrier protein [Parafrankia discariae]|uniref:acyl carrier protein n=1 Tax=Parafrankia discariae TaxID=365528 RepID=UPI00037DEB10|nr:acyl carrier protein [Parafrankia discariae]